MESIEGKEIRPDEKNMSVEELELMKEEKFVNLIIEIIVDLALKEYYEKKSD